MNLKLLLEETGRTWTLKPNRAYVIGSGNDCDIALPYANAMATRHCQVGFDVSAQSWYVEDLGTTQGTYVNQQAVHKALISGQSRILIGGSTYITAIPLDVVPQQIVLSSTSVVPQQSTINNPFPSSLRKSSQVALNHQHVSSFSKRDSPKEQPQLTEQAVIWESEILLDTKGKKFNTEELYDSLKISLTEDKLPINLYFAEQAYWVILGAKNFKKDDDKRPRIVATLQSSPYTDIQFLAGIDYLGDSSWANFQMMVIVQPEEAKFVEPKPIAPQELNSKPIIPNSFLIGLGIFSIILLFTNNIGGILFGISGIIGAFIGFCLNTKSNQAKQEYFYQMSRYESDLIEWEKRQEELNTKNEERKNSRLLRSFKWDDLRTFKEIISQQSLKIIYKHLIREGATVIKHTNISLNEKIFEKDENIDPFSKFKDILTIEEITKDHGDEITENTFIVGIGQNNQPVISNFSKIPHRIVAGTTGSGKTVFIKSVIYQFLYSSYQLSLIDKDNINRKIYIADFKGGLDFKYIKDLYEDEIVLLTEFDELNKILAKLYNMHNKRIELMNAENVENLNELKRKLNKSSKNFLDFREAYNTNPFCRNLLIIDEAASIMHADRKNKEEIYKNLQELAAKSRITGINIIFCSQRPTSEVIPKQISDNMDERIIFRVSPSASQLLLDDDIASELSAELKGIAAYRGANLLPEIIQTPDVPKTVWGKKFSL